jgi:hypothetical protein
MDFFSMSPDDVAEFVEPADVGPQHEERWHSPEAGLATVRALLKHGVAAQEGLPEGVQEDLVEFERILSKAGERGLRWHLAVDY